MWCYLKTICRIIIPNNDNWEADNLMSKLNLAVIFGGRACEHDVSIISALQAIASADKNAYDVIPIFISGEGDWYVGDALRDITFFTKLDYSKLTKVLPIGERQKLVLLRYPQEKRSLFGSGKEILFEADVVMPVMHGVNGEDGTLSGMLELYDVPYTCSGVLGASTGMDKIVMKKLFEGCGFPVLPAEWVERGDWKVDRDAIVDRIEKAIPYPIYVKPANLGSSIGITRANDRAGLCDAIDVAAAFDRRILVEKGVKKLTEVNASVLGFAADVRVSVLEMPIQSAETVHLGFAEKYLKGGSKSQGMKSLARKVPAPVSDELTARIKEMSVQAFKVMDAKGVVRIDYIIDGEDGALYINEINTIPGSLAFYLWEHDGVGFTKLVDEMVKYAYLAAAQRRESVFSYESSILKQMTGGKMGSKGKLR